MRSLELVVIQSDGCPYIRGDVDSDTHRGTPTWGQREEMVSTCQREASGETSPAHPWILDSQPPGPMGNTCCLSYSVHRTLLGQLWEHRSEGYEGGNTKHEGECWPFHFKEGHGEGLHCLHGVPTLSIATLGHQNTYQRDGPRNFFYIHSRIWNTY